MKRGCMRILASVLCVALLTGCSCQHDWLDATCEEPRTCYDCGETKGKPAGHDWEDATCEEPKTCSECGETKGNPKAHSWLSATCSQPMTCSECGKSEGNPSPHDWIDATYEAPKTCRECGATEGEPLHYDSSKKLYAGGKFKVTYEEFFQLLEYYVLDDLNLTAELYTENEEAAIYYIYNARGQKQEFCIMLTFEPGNHRMNSVNIVSELDISDTQREISVQVFCGAGMLINPNLSMSKLAEIIGAGVELEVDGYPAVAGYYQGICYSISTTSEYGMLSIFPQD